MQLAATCSTQALQPARQRWCSARPRPALLDGQRRCGGLCGVCGDAVFVCVLCDFGYTTQQASPRSSLSQPAGGSRRRIPRLPTGSSMGLESLASRTAGLCFGLGLGLAYTCLEGRRMLAPTILAPTHRSDKVNRFVLIINVHPSQTGRCEAGGRCCTGFDCPSYGY